MYGNSLQEEESRGKTAAKFQLRGKTLGIHKGKLGKKKEKVQSKSPPRKGEKDVTTNATKKSVAAKKPTVTKTKTGASVKRRLYHTRRMDHASSCHQLKLRSWQMLLVTMQV